MVDVVRNTDLSRFEARVGDEVAGFAEYQLTDELIIFTHTEVDPSHEGERIGSTLARAALDAVREEGTRQVLPLCPFIKSWIERHRDYADLVYGAPATTAKD